MREARKDPKKHQEELRKDKGHNIDKGNVQSPCSKDTPCQSPWKK